MADALVLSVSEAARLLGVGRNHVYEMVAEGTIPHVRFGRLIKIPRSELERWLSTQAYSSIQ